MCTHVQARPIADPLPPYLRALVGTPQSQGDLDWILTLDDAGIVWTDRFRMPATMALIFPGYP